MSSKDPNRVTIATYTNKHGRERVAAQMSRELALEIAVSDPDAIDKLIGAITERIVKQERAKVDEG